MLGVESAQCSEGKHPVTKRVGNVIYLVFKCCSDCSFCIFCSVRQIFCCATTLSLAMHWMAMAFTKSLFAAFHSPIAIMYLAWRSALVFRCHFYFTACAFLPLYKIFKYLPALALLSLAVTYFCLTRQVQAAGSGTWSPAIERRESVNKRTTPRSLLISSPHRNTSSGSRVSQSGQQHLCPP